MCAPEPFDDIELGDSLSSSNAQQEISESTTQPLLPHNSHSSPSLSVSSTRLRSSRSKNHDGISSSFSSTKAASLLDSLSSTQQMILLSFVMFLFFGMHNILQEAIVNLLSTAKSESGGVGGGFDTENFTLMLGYTEIVGVLTFSYLERVSCTKEGGLTRVAPLRSYPLLTACLFASSSLSNLSLSYINFPTKVGKSSS